MRYICTSIIVATLAVTALADTYQDQKIYPTDGTEQQEFGFSVSVSLDRMIIGAHGDSVTESTGAYVYHYDYDNSIWSLQTKLTSPNNDDTFGRDVYIQGDVAIVGASSDNGENSEPGSGAAYIYRFDGDIWNFEQKLKATSPENSEDAFGHSVVIEGNRAVIGAPRDEINGAPLSGSAYVFYFDGNEWVQEQHLTTTDDDVQGNDMVGFDVSISGDRILLGSWEDNEACSDCGAIYVFHLEDDVWTQETKIVAPATPRQHFGYSVALQDNTAVIGAPIAEDDQDQESGAVYIYELDSSDNSWNYQQTLYASDGENGFGFGRSVAISNNMLVAGSDRGGLDPSSAGAAYQFSYDGTMWSQETKLLPTDSSGYDGFGRSVAVFESIIVVGCPFGDPNGYDSGAAYAFGVPTPIDADEDGVLDEVDNCPLYNPDQADCDGNGIGDVCDIDNDPSTDCDSSGVLDECEELPDCDGDGVPDLCAILNGAIDANPADGIPDNCQGLPIGACCIAGSCIMTQAIECALAGGTSYAGDGVSCQDVGCTPLCDGDSDGNGVVNIEDLLIVISGWGVCP